MKIRLSTLLLVVACLALAVGWLFERSSYESKLNSAVEREAILRRDLMHAIHWTTIPYYQSILSPEKFKELHAKKLAEVVVDCWLMIEHIDSKTICDESDRGSLHQSAKGALLQLNISDSDSFRDHLVNVDMRHTQLNWDWEKSVVLVDDNDKLNRDLEAFVNEKVTTQDIRED